MIPRKFEYYSPQTLQQALGLLRKHGGDAKVLAGGQSLIPMMKLRLVSPKYVVDINNVKGLSYIKEVAGQIRIGAMTRHADIEHSSLIKQKLPLMTDAAIHIADQQVRNLGTIGGAISHADPAGDWNAVMLALEAEFVARGATQRIIKATRFFKGPFQTALRPTEILTEIRIPQLKGRVGTAYMKFERKAGDFATVGVASAVRLNGEDRLEKAGIGLCAVGASAIKATDAEKVLVGQRPTSELVEEAAAAASRQSDPSSDLRGSAEYKKEMVKVFTRRSLRLAFERAGYKL